MIAEMRERLVRKELSCVELTQGFLDKIERENGRLNAYITVTGETALASARAVDARIAAGEPLRLLEGIPLSLKDNLSTRGIKTTCASKMLSDYLPVYDATVWRLLQEQNAVLLGKTNMDEFAMGSGCENSYFGGTANPRDPSRVAGGSSGGAAASVAGGLAVYALGSDTGGSIRQPAAFCGVVGFKPTYGAVSRYGLIAYASSFDQIGPITSTVEDAALVYDAIAMRDPLDSTSRGGRAAFPALKTGVRGVRLGVAEEPLAAASPETAAALEEALRVYERLGAVVTRLRMPVLRYALPVYYILACAEAASNLGRYDGVRYGFRAAGDGEGGKLWENDREAVARARSEGFGAEVKRRILLGNYVLSAGCRDDYYRKAQKLRGAIRRAYEEAFRECDLILSPTTPKPAFPRGRVRSDPTEEYRTDVCTVPANIAGLPALSLPCGADRDGLPIGMQIIGKPFEEPEILAAAYAYERETRGSDIRCMEGGAVL